MAVLVTNDFPPNHGGIQRFMVRLAQELLLQQEPIVVVAPRIENSNLYDSKQPYAIIRYCNAGRLIGFVSMTFSLMWAHVRNPDRRTIASMWFPGGLAACLVPRRLRGRLTVLAHGTEIDPDRRGVRRHLMRYVFSQADVIVANSRFTRQLLGKAGVSERVFVVHPGVDAQRITPNRSEFPTILSVGRLVARKGFDNVIRALPAVLEKFPDAQYHIIGSGPQRDELVRLVREVGVDRHVRFLGAVDDDAMHDAYANAWCFALPVRAIAGDVEGFGVVYLEAAMADLPAIGGIGSGAEDAIDPGSTGLLVNGTSVAELSAALIELLADPARLTTMGVSGRERALREFTWSQTATKIRDLMNA